jgi:uncharacterized protein (DUF2147 family)
MLSRPLSIVAIATWLFAMTTSVFAQSLAGTWLTQDGSSRVQFRSCAQNQCGYIVWLREPVDPATGKARQDRFNSDDSLKGRPLLGLLMITNIAGTTAGAWEGTLYNPRDGNSYKGQLTDLGGGRLQLKGCALLGLICKTEVWTRAE